MWQIVTPKSPPLLFLLWMSSAVSAIPMLSDQMLLSLYLPFVLPSGTLSTHLPQLWWEEDGLCVAVRMNLLLNWPVYIELTWKTPSVLRARELGWDHSKHLGQEVACAPTIRKSLYTYTDVLVCLLLDCSSKFSISMTLALSAYVPYHFHFLQQ